MTIEADQQAGWVRSDYTQAAEAPKDPPRASIAQGTSERLVNFNVPWKLTAYLVGSIVLLSLLGSMAKVNLGLPMLAGSLVGIIFILNQYGEPISQLLAQQTRINLTFLSPLWENSSDFANYLSPPRSVAVLLLIGAATLSISTSVNQGTSSYLQGVCTGFLALPTILGAVLLTALVIKALLNLLGIISILLKWILNHALLPVLRWISIPFIWIWEQGLREIIGILATPFTWVWNVILAPILSWIFEHVLRPIFGIFLGSLISTFCLLPFASVGLSIIEGFRSSWRVSRNPQSLFGIGVSLGFLLFDSALLISLAHFKIVSSSLPITFLLLITAPMIAILRLFFSRALSESAQIELTWREKIRQYAATSKIEVVAAFVMIAFMSVFAEREE